MNINDCKSYVSAENLTKALEKLGFKNHRHVVVCNLQGRYTAIFPGSNVQGPNADPRIVGDLMHYGRHGFMTLG